MNCLNFPFCRYRAPRCQRCRRGFAVISGASSRCTNASCDARPPACRSCGAGVLVTRKGRTGCSSVYAVRLGPAVHEYAEPRCHPPP